ncbi:MAG TPA: leucyl/phenylalanyl-tRNA--protein transferase [Acidimicrobiia bacterium]
MPVEPPPSRWQLPDPSSADAEGICGIGADLEPGTLLAAYRSGLFPMRLGRRGPLGWWSPDPRGVIPLNGLRISRSLRRALPRFEVRVDTAFEEVVRACADPRRPNGWIDDSFIDAYTELHRLGWVHSVEAWRDGVLAGGLYGVAIGGLFAGESMFHRVTDASKVALVALVRLLESSRASLLDVQWVTPHLASLGAEGINRRQYLARLERAVREEVGFPPSTART